MVNLTYTLLAGENKDTLILLGAFITPVDATVQTLRIQLLVRDRHHGGHCPGPGLHHLPEDQQAHRPAGRIRPGAGPRQAGGEV